MRLTKILAVLPVATILILASTPAQAQGSIGFGFTKFGRNSAVGFGFTVPLHHHQHRCWVPGHYETVYRQVWVPGCIKRVWVEPIYETYVDPCGNVTRVLLRAGYYHDVEVGGHYQTFAEQVWVPGYYR